MKLKIEEAKTPKVSKAPMTPEHRAEIFAKEVLTTKDIVELHEISYSSATGLIRVIKSKSDRLKISGLVHIQDYLDALNLPVDRYLMPKKERSYEVDNIS